MMPFWRAIERMPGLSAVAQAWRLLVGAEYERLEPFLRPRDRLATSYPRADDSGGAISYRVVAHGPDDFVGLCDETGERIEIARQDLVVYELDRRALCRAVALAMELEPEVAAVPQLVETQRIGALHHGGVRYAVYLALQPDARTACELALQASGPFLLLAPTFDSLSPAVEATLATRKARYLGLCSALSPDGRGAWRRTPVGDAALAAFAAARAAETDYRNDQTAVFRKSGQLWELGFGGRTVHLEDAKGLIYLAKLLAEPDRPIHVAMLLSGGTDEPVLGSRGETLDPQALQSYKQRILELQEELSEAEEFGNLAGQEAASLELDALVGELARATGLGGRSRQNTDAERLRKTVSMAISRSLAKVTAYHPDLGRHLEASLRLGQFLTYAPAQPVAWTL